MTTNAAGNHPDGSHICIPGPNGLCGAPPCPLDDAIDADEHFPWHYTEFGVLCACGRPCDRDEQCEGVRHARRWESSAIRVTSSGESDA